MKLFKHYRRYLFHPVLYMAAFRLMVALIFLLALTRLVPRGPAPDLVAGFLTVLFALFAFLVYLRTDGLRIPRVKYIRPKKKNDPLRHSASMSDYTDEEPPVSFEELEPEEKDLCSFLSNIINLVIFLVLSFVL
ncbi:MAG: hypothetical protein ACI4MG_06150 [Aristaeellaceae bacterium]